VLTEERAIFASLPKARGVHCASQLKTQFSRPIHPGASRRRPTSVMIGGTVFFLMPERATNYSGHNGNGRQK